MKPFFTYFGGKYRAAPRYPKPEYDTIIEPFAGSAGYSLRYHDRNIILVEKDPLIANLWRYLIRADESDILKLPLVVETSVDDLDICDSAKHLIGFWLNKGTSSPCKTPGKWMRDGLRPKYFWGIEIQRRIASQVSLVKHWTIIEGDYTLASDAVGTWFIDPPYQKAGKSYRKSFIDYSSLAKWCKVRVGQTIVCEAEGADWLKFDPFIAIKSTEGRHVNGVSRESIWLSL